MFYDFIVVGAGIAGASIAYNLAEKARVCLVEVEDHPGMHSTGRSAALFLPTYGPGEIRALTRASRSFFDRPPEGFSDTPLLRSRGCLYVARSEQRARLIQKVERIAASGGHASIVSSNDAIAKVPLLRPDNLAVAAFDPDAMDIDVNALHQGFLCGLRQRGARVITGVRAEFARAGGIWSVNLGDHSLGAPVVVNAAGAWADEVARKCGARQIGLQPLRRTAMLVDPPAGVDIRDWPAVIDADEAFYFKPDAGQLLLSPADETLDGAGDTQPDEMDIAIGIDRVQAVLDITVRRVNHSWAGLRTFAPDRVPAVGFDEHVAGFFWCAGQGGYGIQTAPALALAAASLACREPIPTDIVKEGVSGASLSPARFKPMAGS